MLLFILYKRNSMQDGLFWRRTVLVFMKTIDSIPTMSTNMQSNVCISNSVLRFWELYLNESLQSSIHTTMNNVMHLLIVEEKFCVRWIVRNEYWYMIVVVRLITSPTNKQILNFISIYGLGFRRTVSDLFSAILLLLLPRIRACFY
jgi:hypothetical protein